VAESDRIEDLRRRVIRDPDSLVFAQLAEEYRRAGRFEEAISTCRAGLARHPGYLSARVTLGWALIELDHLDEAQRELERVKGRAPENLTAVRGLEEILSRRRAALDRQPPEIIDLISGPAEAGRHVRPELPADRVARTVDALERFLNAIHGLRTQRRA
jgi:tetratricopeptide (TPR) repeat protein